MALLSPFYNEYEGTPATFSNMLDRFFNDTLANPAATNRFVPKVDVSEDNEEYEVDVAVPGMKKDDFNIDLQDGSIVISGERKFEDEKKEKDYHTVETQYGAFTRSFRVPDDVNTDKIKANYEDGILKVHLPKADTQKNKKKISIN